MSDPQIVRQQYSTSANLQARIELHERFSTNSQPWPRWVFDQFDLPARARILELGGGTGALWRENLDRLPIGWSITLSDMSVAMLEQSRAALLASGKFSFERVDAQAIPFADATFDAVVANHMLYHVADRPRALAEIRRVLAPGGRLYAATNGGDHMRDLKELVQGFALGADVGTFFSAEFQLENGRAQLAPFFERVEERRYECDLLVTELEPLSAYVESTQRIAAGRIPELRRFLAAALERSGRALRIGKSVGMFVCQ
ncbi:MAG TPA: class I SAM-dependent methyltransferase [Herpetosiphonaceae bacterium]|nr:class I SAM-dependent methyltransferase [Herpetosiphonaceae bacterium]